MSTRFALSGKRIVTPSTVISGYILVEDGRIIKVAQGDVPSGLEVIDAGGNLVVPGFIDLHIHGLGGWDLDADPQTVHKIANLLADNGVTAFYPTPATVPLDLFKKILPAVHTAAQEQAEHFMTGERTGAQILGIHLEGPFLNKARKGAMPAEYLLDPDLSVLEMFEELSQGLLKRVTVAPELPGALDFIQHLRNKGYIVAGGHTAATAEALEQGIDAGITVANHMYNAMTSLHHREPGAVGAYLTDDRVVCEIIADGIHVHPLAIETALRCKGPDNLYLISDAVQAAALPPGQYDFIGRTVTIDESGTSRLPDGTIAGSTFLLPKGFRTIVESMGHDPVLAAKLTAANAARVAGVEARKGTLTPGKDADITVLDDNYDVLYCCVRGVWHKKPGMSSQHLINTKIKG